MRESKEKAPSSSQSKFPTGNDEEEEGVNEYEKLLRQLESEIRNHIRVDT